MCLSCSHRILHVGLAHCFPLLLLIWLLFFFLSTYNSFELENAPKTTLNVLWDISNCRNSNNWHLMSWTGTQWLKESSDAFRKTGWIENAWFVGTRSLWPSWSDKQTLVAVLLNELFQCPTVTRSHISNLLILLCFCLSICLKSFPFLFLCFLSLNQAPLNNFEGCISIPSPILGS